MSQSVTKTNQASEGEGAQSGKCVTGQITMPNGRTECEIQILDFLRQVRFITVDGYLYRIENKVILKKKNTNINLLTIYLLS